MRVFTIEPLKLAELPANGIWKERKEGTSLRNPMKRWEGIVDGFDWLVELAVLTLETGKQNQPIEDVVHVVDTSFRILEEEVTKSPIVFENPKKLIVTSDRLDLSKYSADFLANLHDGFRMLQRYTHFCGEWRPAPGHYIQYEADEANRFLEIAQRFVVQSLRAPGPASKQPPSTGFGTTNRCSNLTDIKHWFEMTQERLKTVLDSVSYIQTHGPILELNYNRRK